MKFYFSSFFDSAPTKTNYLRPNKNCNLTSWVSGCEPGWTCSVGMDQKVELKNSKDMPSRTRDCQPCCAGFFCPQGLTCMIRKDMITTLFILWNHWKLYSLYFYFISRILHCWWWFSFFPWKNGHNFVLVWATNINRNLASFLSQN